ncbi:hypothetical protein [Actinoplanes sp. NPDC048796]|uniref:hypothetical protein n=1 Tax=Actinoplanes sp. NPDC048796 TaxID=3155640 RepID=UPI0033FBE582
MSMAMRWKIELLRRRVEEVRNSDPLFVESADSGLYFEVFFSGVFRPGNARHSNRSSVVKSEIVEVCSSVCREWSIDQSEAAADAINARLGVPYDCPRDYFRSMAVRVEIVREEESRKTARRMRIERARIERLQFLRNALYSDPALVMIEHLDRHPEDVSRLGRVEDFRALAEKLKFTEKWWWPIQLAWSQLATDTKSSEGREYSIGVLVDAIKRIDARLADQYKIADLTDRKDQ